MTKTFLTKAGAGRAPRALAAGAACAGFTFTGLACAGLALTGMALVGQIAPAAAQGAGRNVDFSATYVMTLAGVGIGAASLTAKLTPGSYALDMHAQLTGLAGVLVSGKGGARAAGSRSGARFTPSSLAMVASTSSEKRSLRMSFSGGAVSAVEITPPLEEWDQPDRIPVAARHKSSVLDPLSALLMPVSGPDPRSICDRTIPVFDGATRFDIVLSYAGTRKVTSGAWSGEGVVCNARYVPVSGHRPERRMTRFMADNRDMGVTLIPLGASGVYAPWRIHVRTTIGVAAIEMSRISGNGMRTAQAERGQ